MRFERGHLKETSRDFETRPIDHSPRLRSLPSEGPEALAFMASDLCLSRLAGRSYAKGGLGPHKSVETLFGPGKKARSLRTPLWKRDPPYMPDQSTLCRTKGFPKSWLDPNVAALSPHLKISPRDAKGLTPVRASRTDRRAPGQALLAALREEHPLRAHVALHLVGCQLTYPKMDIPNLLGYVDLGISQAGP